MSTSTPSTPDAEHAERERLALLKEAERTKRHLLTTLARIDRKRHHVVEEVEVVRNRFVMPALVAGAIVVCVLVGMKLRGSRRTRAELYSARWRAIQRAWAHPERVG